MKTLCIVFLGGSAFAAGSASGQVIDIVLESDRVALGADGTAEVGVSVFLDRQGWDQGPWADFSGWVYADITLASSGPARWKSFTEDVSATSADAWLGRRPKINGADDLDGPGSFRFGRAGNFTDADAQTQTPPAGHVASGYDRFLLSDVNASVFQDLSLPGVTIADERIEVFRAVLIVEAVGRIEIANLVNADGIAAGGFDRNGSTWNIGFDPDAEGLLGLPQDVETLTVVPAPGVLALLAPAACLRRRREM